MTGLYGAGSPHTHVGTRKCQGPKMGSGSSGCSFLRLSTQTVMCHYPYPPGTLSPRAVVPRKESGGILSLGRLSLKNSTVIRKQHQVCF